MLLPKQEIDNNGSHKNRNGSYAKVERLIDIARWAFFLLRGGNSLIVHFLTPL
jgi:hypothetical protein